jgi:hypothetical protein
MKATNSLAKPSLLWHKFLIYFFFYACIAMCAVVCLVTLVMFFLVGLYTPMNINGIISDLFGLVPLVEKVGLAPVAEILGDVGSFAAKLLLSFLNLAEGVAPRMHIRHFIVCAISVAVAVLALLTRNALAYFEKKAFGFLTGFCFAFCEYFAAIIWLYFGMVFKEVDYGIVIGIAIAMAAVGGLLALFHHLYYKKRKSLFEFNC